MRGMRSAQSKRNGEERVLEMGDPIVPDTHEKSKIVLIGGFLGAGKTTLLKEILP